MHAPKWQCLDCNTRFGESDTWDLEFLLDHKPIPDFVKAHSHCSFNQEELLKSEHCACFHCLTEFYPEEITEWIDDSSGYTAVCPLCGKDSLTLPPALAVRSVNSKVIKAQTPIAS